MLIGTGGGVVAFVRHLGVAQFLDLPQELQLPGEGNAVIAADDDSGPGEAPVGRLVERHEDLHLDSMRSPPPVRPRENA